MALLLYYLFFFYLRNLLETESRSSLLNFRTIINLIKVKKNLFLNIFSFDFVLFVFIYFDITQIKMILTRVYGNYVLL